MRLEAAWCIYPHVVAEIVFVEKGEVDGDDIGDGVVAEGGFAGKAGDAVSGQPVVFDIGPCLGVRQPEHMRGAADAEMQGEIANDAGEP